MSFIVAAGALLLALIISLLLDGTSERSERGATADPFVRGETDHRWHGSDNDGQPPVAGLLLDGQ